MLRYLEPWHADVYDFIELRKNHGKEEQRARDLFLGLWIPDLFMKRVKQNEEGRAAVGFLARPLGMLSRMAGLSEVTILQVVDEVIDGLPGKCFLAIGKYWRRASFSLASNHASLSFMLLVFPSGMTSFIWPNLHRFF